MKDNVSIVQVLLGVLGLCVIIGLCGLIDGNMGAALFTVGCVVVIVLLIAVLAIINHFKS